METPLSLTLLYTANLRGNIASLPRLFTLMQRLQAEQANSLILDLGRACDDAAWHCQQTGGRSMLIVLDGMGYHAANIAGTLDDQGRQKLASQVTMALVNEAHCWQHTIHQYLITATLRPKEGVAGLQVCLTPADCTCLTSGVLYLQELGTGQIGKVKIELADAARITSNCCHDLAPDTPPNPSITAAVEFVESEARLFQRKQSRERSS